MTDHEKMIEILEDIDGESGFRLIGYHDVRRVADHLIANGVTVQKHGRWILVDTGKWIGVCSNCNRQDHIDHLATYCRFCGAKMVVGKDD